MTALEPSAVDALIRRQVYDHTLTYGRPPTRAELVAASGLETDALDASLRRLAEGRVVVLQPVSGALLMANPFSAVPTPFLVDATGYRAWGNCIWDAMGIPAMLGAPGTIRTSCGCCGDEMVLDVDGAGNVRGDGIVHFGVPAARWWENIVFT